jgi:hypothetical protein
MVVPGESSQSMRESPSAETEHQRKRAAPQPLYEVIVDIPKMYQHRQFTQLLTIPRT